MLLFTSLGQRSHLTTHYDKVLTFLNRFSGTTGTIKVEFHVDPHCIEMDECKFDGTGHITMPTYVKKKKKKKL